MPYTEKDMRGLIPLSQGELCYEVTQICQNYLNGMGESFARYGEIRNALASAWEVHFLPKLLAYENVKRAQNGDVV